MTNVIPRELVKLIDAIKLSDWTTAELRKQLVAAYKKLPIPKQRACRDTISKYVWLPCDCFADDGLHKPSCPRYIAR